MAAKVKWDRGAWWVFTHFAGGRKKKRIGPTKADKRQAVQIARKIDAALALGAFRLEPERALPCDAEIRRWHTTYSPTMKWSYQLSTRGLIEKHLVPFFGSQDLRELREADLLRFVSLKLQEGLAPRTIRNALSVLRRVLNLAQREGLIDRNPASRIGELMRRVGRQVASEGDEVDYWSREEASTLIALAREHEAAFAPLLVFLLSTGARRGEALGLRWEDVAFESPREWIEFSSTDSSEIIWQRVAEALDHLRNNPTGLPSSELHPVLLVGLGLFLGFILSKSNSQQTD